MEIFVDGFGKKLLVHDKADCSGCCVVHNPLQNHMKDWPLHWRDDRGFFERIDPEGVGHPAPEDMLYHDLVGNDISIHCCNGLCNPQLWEKYLKDKLEEE